MRFVITGSVYDWPDPTLTLIWTDGVLTGDDDAIDALRARALRYDGIRYGPPEGPHTVRAVDHIRSPVSAILLVGETFFPGYRHDGDVPQRPDSPEIQ